MNLIFLHFWRVAYLPGRPWFNAQYLWKFPKLLSEMCKICTREDFISLWMLAAGCWHCCLFCIYSGFLALECNQFANFRYFAAFANVQVFGSLAFFLAGYRLLPALFAIYEYFVLFLHSSASNAVCCLLSVRPIVYTLPGGALLSFVLALPGPIGLCKWCMAASWLLDGCWLLCAFAIACVFSHVALACVCVWVVFWPKVLNLANGVVIFVEIELHKAHTLNKQEPGNQQ